MDSPDLHRRFTELFGPGDAPLAEVRAPGRVNLIGEHTDYNDGFVCPIAIDRHITLLFRPRADAVVRLHSLASAETADFSIAAEIPKSAPAWSLYSKGVAEALRLKGLLHIGIDGLLVSTVPAGGGLSSSAALEVATGLALLTANRAVLDPVDLALACQWAEHHYPGMPCGIMDQFISAMGRQGHALLLDCRDRTFRHVPLDDPGLRIVVCNSNVKHALVAGEYAQRREQCELAAKALRKNNPHIHSLREASLDLLEASRADLAPVIFCRARHVISENGRTVDFANALSARDYARCGRLMFESHASLRDDFEASCREIDALVEIARPIPGVYGARITGGGFGGCIVALVAADSVDALLARIAAEYPRLAGRSAGTFVTVASAGARVVN